MRVVDVAGSSAVAAIVPGALAVLVGQTTAVDAWSGWSAFGLAGLILCWLFFRHLPDKDKQLKEKDEAHLAQVRDLTKTFTDQLKEMSANSAATERERRADFKAALDTVVAHCEREGQRINETLQRQGNEATAAVVDLRQTLEEMREDRHRRHTDPPDPRKRLPGPREQQT